MNFAVTAPIALVRVPDLDAVNHLTLKGGAWIRKEPS